jgi:E3 SUMO-protein ligase RanBP2
LVDTDIRLDASKIKYWIERADKQFPHNPVVFQLKEKLLTMEKPNNSSKDLEALITCKLMLLITIYQNKKYWKLIKIIFFS